MGDMKNKNNLSHRVCLAPMLKTTDRHFRYLFRLMSKHLLLYTEMITAKALIHGDRARFFAFDETEHPIAIQLGDAEPEELAIAAKFAEEAGFDEVNLNVGCPSPRVQAGNFGASLMKEPELVAACVSAMKAVVTIPVTVKMRTGIGRDFDKEYLHRFISLSKEAGCETVIIHARNVWFDVKRPKENRQKPGICYERVYEVKRAFPELTIVVNGDIFSLQEGLQHLEQVDGIMLGRLAFQDPYQFAQADQLFYESKTPIISREELVERYLEYVRSDINKKEPVRWMTRHLINLYAGQPNATEWRRKWSTVNRRSDLA